MYVLRAFVTLICLLCLNLHVHARDIVFFIYIFLILGLNHPHGLNSYLMQTIILSFDAPISARLVLGSFVIDGHFNMYCQAPIWQLGTGGL